MNLIHCESISVTGAIMFKYVKIGKPIEHLRQN